MKRFYISQDEFNNKIITGDEFNHIKNVMRLKEGDEFIAFFGDDFDYECEIETIKKNCLEFKILNKIKNTKNPLIVLDIFQSLAKGEKMELITQKATEMGVSTIFPLYVKNCDVKPNSNKPERLRKIVVNACKQCGRSNIPTITDIITFNDSIKLLKKYDLVVFANETEKASRVYDLLEKHKSAKKIAVIIGPEGGFTPEEINIFSTEAFSVSLGSRILRTETAAIYLSSIINDFYRN